MLSTWRSQLSSNFVRHCRSITQEVTQSSCTITSASSIPTSRSTKPYFVPRNTRGNLPVYSDIRNGGTRQLVLIRNVEGNVSALAKELSQSLFPRDSREAFKMKVKIDFSRHVVISGGNWKSEVMVWLKEKGF